MGWSTLVRTSAYILALISLLFVLCACSFSERRLEDLSQRVSRVEATEAFSFDNPLFGLTGRFSGLLHPDRFNRTVGFRIFLRGPHRRDRIPVIMVHGYATGPRPFVALANSLDPELYEPWFCYYATGVEPEQSAVLLHRSLAAAASRYDQNTIALVANSFGGLVVRQALRGADQDTALPRIPLFVSVSTPWGGSEHRRFDRERSYYPASWGDINHESGFLAHLFDDPLPPETEFHLIYSLTERDRRSIPGEDDGVLSELSMVRPEAVAEAASVTYVPDVYHLDTITYPRTIAKINELLRESDTHPP